VESKFWEDVEAGEKLPVLEFPITVKTLILAVCGTRDLMPYHHDPAYSKSVGNRDMFVNTMFEQALFGRYVTDFVGPESDFRETGLQMLNQLCPGDVAKIEGTITEKLEEAGEKRIKLKLSATNAIGIAATGTATLAMPSRESGEVVPIRSMDRPTMDVHPQIPDFAKAWLGKESPKAPGGYPVSEVQVMYWCDMVEDANPLYSDGDYARKSRHNGMIAPPMGLITWTMARGGQTGVDFEAPDGNCPERKPWPPKEQGKGGGIPMPPGMKETIAQGSVQTYGVPVRPGDRIFSTNETLNCSPLKETKLGPGYFQTNLQTFYNQKDEIVGTNLFTLLRYGGTPEEG
jgi:acyl dehydratase